MIHSSDIEVTICGIPLEGTTIVEYDHSGKEPEWQYYYSRNNDIFFRTNYGKKAKVTLSDIELKRIKSVLKIGVWINIDFNN